MIVAAARQINKLLAGLRISRVAAAASFLVPKGRRHVAMGASPWLGASTRTKPQRGDSSPRQSQIDVVPLGLCGVLFLQFHGLAPMAT